MYKNLNSIYNIIYKTIKLLDSSLRKRLVLLIFLVIISMTLEIFTLGMLLPVLNMLVNFNIGHLEYVPRFILQYSNEELIIIFLFLFILFYLFKILMTLFIHWMTLTYYLNLQVYLSRKLFRKYLYQNFTFHVNRNSSELIRNIKDNIVEFASFGFGSLLILMTESFIIFGILVFLLYIHTKITLCILAVLIIVFVIFNFVFSARSLRLGKMSLDHGKLYIQHLYQGLNSIKEIKILNRQESFLNNFVFHHKELTKINTKIGFIDYLPRAWLELIIILCISFSAFFLHFSNVSILNYFPLFGLYAAVTLRILPSCSKIFAAIQRFKFGIAKIENLYDEFNLETEFYNTDKNTYKKNFKNEIELENISFKYSGQNYSIFKKVNLKIKKNTKVGVVGKSGSGKSTLIDMLLGLIEPTEGKIYIDGIDLKKNITGWQKNIGYVAQNIILTDDSLKKNIAFGLEDNFIDNNKIMDSIKKADLEEFLNKLPEGLETRVGEFGSKLSGGQLQRIGIARALYNDPEILFLDEATSSLDKETENNVINTVMSLKNKTIIIISHKYSAIEKCDMIVEVKDEKIKKIDK